MVSGTAARTGTPPRAGFWVRVGSLLIDLMVLSFCSIPLVAIDMYVFDGDFGSFDQSEVVDEVVVDIRTETLEDGWTRTYTKALVTTRDMQGRRQTSETETTASVKGKKNLKSFTSRVIEADPDFGGKYAPYYKAFVIVAISVYFALMWSSPRQNTIGGSALNMRVTDCAGEGISRKQAFARVAAAWLSAASVIGFLMIPFTRDKRGLHDFIAGTLVVQGAISSK